MWLAGQLIANYQLQRCTGFWPVSCSSHTPLFHSQGVGVGGFLTFPEAQAAALHHPPRLISDYLAGGKKSQNKNF
jgi:hypothetical protein